MGNIFPLLSMPMDFFLSAALTPSLGEPPPVQVACSFLGKHYKVLLERVPLAPGVLSHLCCLGPCNIRLHLHVCSLRSQSLVLQLLLPLPGGCRPWHHSPRVLDPQAGPPRPGPHLGPHVSRFQFITTSLSFSITLFAGAWVGGAGLRCGSRSS